MSLAKQLKLVPSFFALGLLSKISTETDNRMEELKLNLESQGLTNVLISQEVFIEVLMGLLK